MFGKELLDDDHAIPAALVAEEVDGQVEGTQTVAKLI